MDRTPAVPGNGGDPLNAPGPDSPIDGKMCVPPHIFKEGTCMFCGYRDQTWPTVGAAVCQEDLITA